MRKILYILIFSFFTCIVKGQDQLIPHHWETVIWAHDIWHYFKGHQQPPTNWNQPTFTDEEWLLGEGGIGYGDNDDGTEIEQCTSVYLRRKFTIKDRSKVVSALIHADYDDGIIIYLNGHEIVRDNLSSEPVKYNTLADQNREASMYKKEVPPMYFIEMQDLKEYLYDGDNVLAVQVHNSNPESSDLSSAIYLTLGMADETVHYRKPPAWFQVPQDVFTSNLPLMHIKTGGKIIGRNKLTVNLKIIDNQTGQRNHLGSIGNVYDGMAGIGLRGHASSTFDQVPYNIETRDEFGENNNVELLGMPKENDWALIGNWGDKSMLRHSLSYHLSEKMGFYAPRGRHCEVYINNEYRGVYILSEKIKRDKNRVDIAKLKADENSGVDISGGYIFRLDHYRSDGSDSWTSTFRTPNSAGDVHFVYHYPEVQDITIYQDSYIRKFINDFEIALFGDHFKDPVKGYRAYINVPSFINFLIVNEVSRNYDKKSNYYHKDKDRNGVRSLIQAGPVWDFDWAWKYYTRLPPDESGWEYLRANSGIKPPYPGWFIRLMEDPQFVNEFHTTYFNYRKTVLSKASIYHYMDSIATLVDEAQKRHFDLYPIWGVQTGAAVHNVWETKKYEDEIARLKRWISNRLDWMDANMPGKMIDTSEFVPSPITVMKGYGNYYGEEVVSSSLEPTGDNFKIFPVPFDNYFYVQSDNLIEGVEVYSISGEMLRQVDVSGEKNVRVEANDLIRGVYLVTIKTNSGITRTMKISK